MKKLVVVAIAAVALSAEAMPTEAEFAKASKDVQAALAAWLLIGNSVVAKSPQGDRNIDDLFFFPK